MIDKQYERQALFRRIRLFGVGLLIGCVCVYFMLWRGRDLGFWTPGSRVLETIRLSHQAMNPKADCKKKCLNITDEELKALFNDKGQVDFSNSQVHQQCPEYIINGIKGNNLHVRLTSCDSTVTILDISRNGQSAGCPDCDK
jgi:hypothetical protein